MTPTQVAGILARADSEHEHYKVSVWTRGGLQALDVVHCPVEFGALPVLVPIGSDMNDTLWISIKSITAIKITPL